jgi:hypothetical protein
VSRLIGHLVNRFKAMPREVGQTMEAKVAQGATELSNALFAGHGYSPYTADNAAHRAQFQNRDQSLGLER